MREIGSEFWDVPVIEKNSGVFPESTQWFLSGRSALRSIVKELVGCHTVAMPSWCCDSMIKPFIDAGIKVLFFAVYWDNGLMCDANLDCDVLFRMDYFGYSVPCSDLLSYKGVIIRDVTHSIFSHPSFDADYYFGSLRKWCGVWTGGYGWTGDGHCLSVEQGYDWGYTALRAEAMQLKRSYINASKVSDKEYLHLYEAAESALERVGAIPANERDVLTAQRLDIESIKKKRRMNAKVLRAAFQNLLIFPDLQDEDCPMFVPILVPNGNRDKLRKHLAKHGIYCPIHWPVSEYHKLDERTAFIYMNELSLVCDQRYTEEDMQRIVEIVKLFWKGE